MKAVFIFVVIVVNLKSCMQKWISPELSSGSSCSDAEQCIPLIQCSNLCNKVNQGLLQSDKTFQSLLSEKQCGFGSGKIKVCCAEENVFEDDQCPELDPLQDVKDNSTCGKRFSVNSFITGGTNTNPGEWPWMARLLYNAPQENSGKVTNCGGSLISRRHVVTAAHCIQDDFKPVVVALGDSDVTTDYDCFDAKNVHGCSSSGEACYEEEACAPKHVEVAIKDILIYEKYEYETCSGCNNIPIFDIALIVLENPVQFTKFIQPVCLPNLNEKSEGPLTITGWGNTIAGILKTKTSSILQELNVEEVQLSECQTIWKEGFNIDIKTSHLCASTGVHGSTSCKGDSGGPLVRQVDFFRQISELAGVVSFGISTCGNADYPLGFTRIDGEVNSWLQEQVGEELPKHIKN